MMPYRSHRGQAEPGRQRAASRHPPGRQWCRGGNAIAVDGTGSGFVTGKTYSSDLTTTPGAFDTNYNGGGDALAVRLAMRGGSTYT